MVFGNMGDDSGTGVAFTRNPSTGENKFYGEYLMNAQGEDVVAGIRTPQPTATRWASSRARRAGRSCSRSRTCSRTHYKDMQDIEFTIEKGKLYMLQTRNGKRTAAAAVRIAVDMVKEKLIDEKTAVMRVEPASLDQLLHPTFDPKAEAQRDRQGPAGQPGRGRRQDRLHRRRGRGARRRTARRSSWSACETSPEDIGGMHVAEGILTAPAA